MRSSGRWSVVGALVLALTNHASAAESQNDWAFGGALYGWFPDISGDTRFGEFRVDIEQILDNLRFTFQGSFDARRGRGGVVTDVIYLDVHASKSHGPGVGVAFRW